MALIPGTDQSQVLNASSPVPVGATGDERFQGETVANFGHALFALGDAMDSAARQQRARQQKLDLESAKGLWDVQNVAAMTQTASEGADKNDYSGQGGINRYQDRMAGVRQDVLASIDDPDVRAGFTAYSNQNMAAHSMQIGAIELKKIDDRNNEKANKITNLRAKIVEQNPDTLEAQSAQMDAIMHEIPGMSEAQAQKASIDARKNLFTSAMNGLANNGKFKQAQSLLDSEHAGVFTATEIQEKKKAVLDMMKEKQSWDWRTHDHMVQEQTRLHKERSDKMARGFVAQLENAKNEWEIEAVRINARSTVASGAMEPEGLELVTKVTKNVTEENSLTTTAFIFDELEHKRMTLHQANSYVLNAIGKGDLDKNSGIALWKFLTDKQERLQRDPLYMKEVTEAVNYMKSQGQPKDISENLMKGIYPPDTIRSRTILNTVIQGIERMRGGTPPESAATGATTAVMGRNQIPAAPLGVGLIDRDSDEVAAAKLKAYLTRPDIIARPQFKLEQIKKFDKWMMQRKEKAHTTEAVNSEAARLRKLKEELDKQKQGQ